MSEKEHEDLLDKIRGKTPEDKLRKRIEVKLKADIEKDKVEEAKPKEVKLEKDKAEEVKIEEEDFEVIV